MNEYKSINKYLKKNKKPFSIKTFISKLFSKILLGIIVLLLLLITIKIDKKNNGKIYNYMISHNINFASISQKVKGYIGNIFPSFKEEITPVFNEKIKYNNPSIYQDGVALKVDENYLVPAIEEGIVVFSGDKELYGKTVIIQQSDGTFVWYGNLKVINANIYDYINKGSFVGEVSSDTLYMVFQKDNEYKDYKDYI